ncbi:LmeA family phospholipid-binding protein [Merismopedia glauca]|uniref:DUF2993 domain-containing protein n=1 Tax=Merismopedia glauca CCAP 1448/3 TaxID=1296344 RepID=A0A2T1C3H9_9CYAN|nr:DUF2993 domain-containing protein [Merismopedia glauca]PSB02819.1 DUF2993 domain-containing protein [Merismopedia glauca CCAP 1448/3]
MSEKQSRIISKVLSPAGYLWLRSQVSQAETIDVKISGGDRQILGGYIPHVSILARQAIYQGLHLTQVELTGENIRVNLGQIIQGKPLRLLEPVPVRGELVLKIDDLQASLSSSLLSTALKDLLVDLLVTHSSPEIAASVKNQPPIWENVTLSHNQIHVSGVWLDNNCTPRKVLLAAGLQLASSHVFTIHGVQVEIEPDLQLDIAEFKVDLGDHVQIEELSLEPDYIIFRGGLQVLP